MGGMGRMGVMGWAEGRWSPGAGREGDFRLYNFHRYGFRTLGERVQMLHWLYWLYWFFFEIGGRWRHFVGLRRARRGL